jgi:chromate transporter
LAKVKKIKRFIFLKDVFIIAISAFGGPEMHISLFIKRMVQQKKYLTEKELMELYSLSQMLPGPSSTQTITSMGYKFGGAFLAFLTLITWILPAFIFMSLCSFLVIIFEPEMVTALFKYMPPLAVAFVITYGIKMLLKVNHSPLSWYFAAGAFVIAALLRHPFEKVFEQTPWIFPIVLIAAGAVYYFLNKKELQAPPEERAKLKIDWKFPVIWAAIFVAIAVLIKIYDTKILILFENMYRFGTLVFGGGNVLIPMLREQYIEFNQWLTSDEFLNGIALKQAVPGPIFTISSYMGGMIMSDQGVLFQILGCLVATLGIFLPGTLMIFFIYPIWGYVKHFKLIQKSLDGVVAAASGLVMAAGYLLFLPVAFNWGNKGGYHYTNLAQENWVNWFDIGIVLVLVVLMYKMKLPAPIWVLIALIAGYFF